jgi:hypothetical protein
MKITKLPNGGELYEYTNGEKYWFLNDRIHREDGPAIEYVHGDKYWYLNGTSVSQTEFERLMKLKAFW